jgi:outer membrane receptor for ferrienterochelin and colicins
MNNLMQAQNSKIQLVQKNNNKPLIYANVSWQVLNQEKWRGYEVSDEKGFVNIPVESDKRIIISATSIGYKPVCDTIVSKHTSIISVEEDVLNLEQVTVTGTRTPHTLKNAPVLTQVIGEKDLEAIDSETIVDVLEVEMPGMEMASHGGIPVMNMMGLENQYSLILIDGVRMAKSLHKSVDFTRINTADIERVEIVRGASSALYGSDAMGGVINIITKKPKKDFSINADFRYQERNQKNHSQKDLDDADGSYAKDYFKNIDRQNLNANLSIGFHKGSWQSKTFLNYKSRDAYTLKDRKGEKRIYKKAGKVVQRDIKPELTTVNGFEDYSVNQNFIYKKGKWNIDLEGNYYYHNEFDIDLKNLSTEVGPTDNFHEIFKSYTAKGKANYQINKKSGLTFLSHYDAYLRYNYDEKKDFEDKTHNNEYLTNKLTYNSILGNHKILAEIESLQQFLESNKFILTGDKVLKKSVSNTVLILQDELQLSEKAIMVVGIRAGYHSTFDFHWSPSLNLKYNLGLVNMRFTYARGFRSPDLKELYFNWSHLGMFNIIGNEDLQPETNNYFAYSLDFVNAARNLNATFIASYNKLNDKIDGIWTDNEEEYSYRNFDSAEVYILEGMLKWKFLENFSLKSGYIYNKTEKSIDGVDLSTMSPMALTAQLQYQFSKKKYRFTANISGKITGKKDVVSQDSDEESPYHEEYYTVKYPTYSIWNLNVNQYFGKHFKLKMGLKNVFDYNAPIVSFNSTNSPGRRFYVAVGYQF